MRLLFVLIIGGLLGWIVGSLYPAPRAWLASINLAAIQQRLASSGEQAHSPLTTIQTGANAPTTIAAAPSSAPSAQSAPRPASRGVIDEQTLNQYRAWIHEARQAHPYADSEERMYALMICESRGQAGLISPAGSYSGLFQYSAGTWRGVWNSYRDQSILDPRAQIFATALAWQRRMQAQWGACYTQAH